MSIFEVRDSGFGVVVHGFDPAAAQPEDIALLRKHLYHDKVVVLRDLPLSPRELVALGELFGELVTYHEPMYHHPDEPQVFVSSNVPQDGRRVGVPKTGVFWHSDYQFMPEPFAFTIFAPQILPTGSRGTFFIDMAQAYATLPQSLRDEVAGRHATHSARRYFKIRPEDVYRPIGELVAEVELKTPPVTFPAVMTHPATGEQFLYLSEGFTTDLGEGTRADLVTDLLEATGQLDTTYQHPLIRQHTYEPGDVVVWDNRTLIHRALHAARPSPTVSHRVTAMDGLPLYLGQDR